MTNYVIIPQRICESVSPLTSSGLKQTRELASFRKLTGVKLSLIVRSPLLRISQTAGIISNLPIWNTGYAQLSYDSATRQWAVLKLNSQPSNTQTEGSPSWQQD